MRARFSIEHSRELLGSSSTAKRIRAYAQLSELDSPEALQVLNASLSPALSKTERKDEARHLLWELCRHAYDSKTQASLFRVLVGANQGPPIDPSLRQIAALGLAAERSNAAISLLAKALSGEVDSATFAQAALLAHPPRELSFLIGDAAPSAAPSISPSIALVQLLGDLGDQRAFAALRRWVKQGNDAVQNAALFSLAQLGDYEVVPVAEQWLKRSPSPARREAALEVLDFSGRSKASSSTQRHQEPAQNLLSLAIALTSATLRARVTSNSPQALSAAFALAARDSEAERPLLLQLLQSPDALLRAHTVLGLAYSAERSASGILTRIYQQDDAWQVRWACVAALGFRGRPQDKTVEQAAQLDPDANVRGAARAILAGARASLTASGDFAIPFPHASSVDP
ncbi:MAG TPA: HEAT repeat domain-containing protein [Polyangiaceae bacterium]|nr:HEAT repeat domain-containing protein [Polyangiaceae bacterium]